MNRLLLFCLLFLSGVVNSIKSNSEEDLKTIRRKRTKVKTIMKAILELHLYAVLLFTVVLTAFSFFIQGPPATVVLYASVASYVTAIFCVAADRTII